MHVKSRRKKYYQKNQEYCRYSGKYYTRRYRQIRKNEKSEQVRNQKAKEMKCSLNLLANTNVTTKSKNRKKIVETDSGNKYDINLRETPRSPIEEMSERSNIDNEYSVMAET